MYYKENINNFGAYVLENHYFKYRLTYTSPKSGRLFEAFTNNERLFMDINIPHGQTQSQRKMSLLKRFIKSWHKQHEEQSIAECFENFGKSW